MTRRVNESFEDFKKRMIDPISASYCSAKWYNATIWLGHGQTTSCHHPPGHYIDPKELIDNPSAIHNTQHKKKMRKMMLEGERPNECEYCWKVEDIGRDNISDRTYKTEIFKDEDIIASSKMDWQEDVMLKTLEISFDRTCNFACSYCNPGFSTTWVKDIKKYGGYKNIQSDGRGHFIDLETISQSVFAQGTWYLNDQLSLTAGVRWSDEEKELMDKLILGSHHIPEFEVYTSNEAVGEHSEYIRDGMVYDEWLKNIDRLIVEGNLKKLHMMMTINSLCLASITEFMDAMLVIKRKHGINYPIMTLNILRFPSFQSVAALPISIKKFYKEKIEKWLSSVTDKNEKDFFGRPLLSHMEISHIQRLIDYLDVIKTPHMQTSSEDKLHNHFKNFYHQYDIRRGKDFRTTFPEIFVDWYDSIDVAIPTKEQIITVSYIEDTGLKERSGDPATEEGGYISDELIESSTDGAGYLND